MGSKTIHNFHCMEVEKAHKYIFQNIFFCSPQKKVSYTGLETTHFSFLGFVCWIPNDNDASWETFECLNSL